MKTSTQAGKRKFGQTIGVGQTITPHITDGLVIFLTGPPLPRE